MLFASLPWYDFPSTAKHLDDVYSQICQHLLDALNLSLAETLDRQTPLHEQWSDSALFLSQCCGPDLQTPAGQALEVIARPVFNTLNCPPGYYYSHIVARHKKLGPAPNVVVNSTTSFSGHTALLNWLAQNDRSYSNYQISRSHQGSINRLLSGEADVAAIDAYSWQFINDDNLEIIGRSETAPAPPFVRHSDCGIDAVRLSTAIDMAFRESGKQLQLTTLAPADNQLYVF